jgi:hypothetical protein
MKPATIPKITTNANAAILFRAGKDPARARALAVGLLSLVWRRWRSLTVSTRKPLRPKAGHCRLNGMICALGLF